MLTSAELAEVLSSSGVSSSWVTYLGVKSEKSSNLMRPTGVSPIVISKNTTGRPFRPAPRTSFEAGVDISQDECLEQQCGVFDDLAGLPIWPHFSTCSSRTVLSMMQRTLLPLRAGLLRSPLRTAARNVPRITPKMVCAQYTTTAPRLRREAPPYVLVTSVDQQ